MRACRRTTCWARSAKGTRSRSTCSITAGSSWAPCARAALADAAKYATTRRQFGRPIAGFGAVRQKLADMAIRLYAAESMLIRTAGLLDDRLHAGSDGSAMAAALEEFAIE